MSGRRMLRDIMTISDVYQYAESIMEMLREDYGSYDADSLDEVLVEETFAQRLAARGYEVRPWADGAATEPPATPAATPPVPLPAGDVVPVTIVRSRRTPGAGSSAERTSGSSAPQRTRRTSSSAETPRAPASGGDSPPRAKSDSPRSSGTTAPRTRRTSTRTPRNNGDSEA